MIVAIGGINSQFMATLIAKPLCLFPHEFSILNSLKPLDENPIIFIYLTGLKFEGDITVLFDVSFRDINPY